MKHSFLWLAALGLVVGCSSNDDGPVGTTDTGSVDSGTADTLVADSASETAADSTAEAAADSTSEDSAADTIVEFDTLPVCSPTGLGDHCDDTNPCAEGLRCYGFGSTGFCAPLMPECGGFAMVKCPTSPVTTCLRSSGDLGFCADYDQRACICAKSPTLPGC